MVVLIFAMFVTVFYSSYLVFLFPLLFLPSLILIEYFIFHCMSSLNISIVFI